MELMELAVGLSIIIFGFYYWMTLTFDYWSSRGIPGPSPVPYFGNMFQIFAGKTSIGEYVKSIYDDNRDCDMFGLFIGSEPVIVLLDPERIKDVLVRDFSTFPEHGGTIPDHWDKNEPLFPHLFNLEAARWRPMRQKMASIFALGKMRKMFYLLLECGENLTNHLNECTRENDVVECRKLTAGFAMDVIGRCAFGLSINTFANGGDKFHEMCTRTYANNLRTSIIARIRDHAPWLYSLLRPLITDKVVHDFFVRIMRETIDYRKKNHVVKYDFIDLLMELQDNPRQFGEIELTDVLLTAQLAFFFVAGYETSSSTMTNALYEIAQQPKIQKKIRNEIIVELAKSNGEINPEVLDSMKYLQKVFQETLRKYPIAPIYMRQSVKPYTFSSRKLTLDKGAKVIIPTFAIHRDPKIYPNPELFDPERFTEEAIKSRHPMNWIPFGEGPRSCIGGQFAYFQMKIGVIKILQNFKIEICDKTRIPHIIDMKNFVLGPAHDVHLKFTKIH